MELTRHRIIEVLINALKEVQQDIVDEPESIDEDTQPIGDLQDFDSLTSVEVTAHCPDALGFPNSLPFPSLFISKGRKALTVGDVADRIMKIKI